jgi:hypothetical protein
MSVQVSIGNATVLPTVTLAANHPGKTPFTEIGNETSASLPGSPTSRFWAALIQALYHWPVIHSESVNANDSARLFRAQRAFARTCPR